MTTTANPITRRNPPHGDSAQALRLAAIDVGSNSIHMIVAQADADGAITTLWRLKESVGLQANLKLESVNVTLRLSEVFAKVQFPPAALRARP